MHNQPLAVATPVEAPRWKRWLIYSPLARIVIFVLMCAALTFGIGALAHASGWNGKTATPTAQALMQLLMRAVPAVIAYWLLVHLIERRRMTELAPRRMVLDGMLGLLAGLLLFSAVVGVLWLLDVYHVIGTHPNAPWLPALLVVGLGAGIGEEIISRGVLFRIAEEGMGTWWALAISAVFFGAAHIANPGATLWSSAAIAIEAGLLFGMIFHVTRSLA
ncbi:MAG: CPBP family intramembrane glutamic endopeptidase, partial [Thermomonas sp.]